MSDISKINPNGTEYNLKDATARSNIGNLSNLETTNKSSLVNAVNEVKSGLTSVPIIKTFEVNVSSGATSINFSNSKPADFLHAISASSRSGGGAIIAQLNDTYIYFSSGVSADAIIQIVYIAST